MRFLVTVAVLTCVMATTFGRPAQSGEPGESIQEEVEYEGDEEPASNEDSLRDEGDSNLDKKEPIYEQDEEEDIQKPINTEGKRDAPAPSDNRSSKDKSDESPDYKLNTDRDSEDMKPNDGYKPNIQQRSNKYTEVKEADEQAKMGQNSANIDVNTSNREQFAQANRRRNSKTTTDDKGDELFENAVVKERPNKLSDRAPNLDSAIESNHEGFFKHYYKTLLQGVDEKASLDNKNDENLPSNFYRNRRQTQNLGLLENSESKDNSKNTIYGKEEMAIKRHIEKLSDQELEDLLNALPEDKRVLLNKIIESEKSHSENLSKRDITKKAGAVEENNDIDNGVFDSSKLQGGGTSVDIKNEAGNNIDTTEKTKQTEYHIENAEVSSPKKPNSLDLSCDKDAIVNLDENKSGVHLNDVPINGESKSETNVETNIRSSKINNKRETDLNNLGKENPGISDTTFISADFNPSDFNENTNEEFGYNSQDEDLSQLISTEELLENNNIDHASKREACLEDTDSYKSLEESFPSSDTYKESGQYSEMDMVPLVRVKRKNEGSLIKKRSAELVPDDKVAYIPYRAENDDDGSEERSEFEDEGFYDRTFNYAKDNENSQTVDDTAAKSEQSKNEKTEHSNISRDENIESDTMNIGSDSDSVLSGVEGVDDNLMISSKSRNRRTVENKSTGEENAQRASITDTNLKTQTDNLNVLNYQENDAFGPLPRNYEGDLNRLKRIRRLKTSCDDVSSSNTGG